MLQLKIRGSHFRWKIANKCLDIRDRMEVVEIEAVAQRYSVKMSLFFNLIKKRFWYRCVPVNFGKFLKNTFLYKTPLVAASAEMIPVKENRDGQKKF